MPSPRRENINIYLCGNFAKIYKSLVFSLLSSSFYSQRPSMATSMASVIFPCIFALSLLGIVSSSSMCPQQSTLFVNTLQSQCPLSYYPHTLLEVDGNFLDRALSSKQSNNVYTSVLFYASWCPFSHDAYFTFEVLSSMFPQIKHLAVEQSSAMPSSVFSRFGIHSLPSILIVNQTSKVRYRGRKDLPSLIQFYRKTTGLDPSQYFTESSKKSTMQSWNVSSLKEIIIREPYLVFRYIVPLFEGAFINIPRRVISSQSLLGLICSPSELGNIWRDEPNVGASPTHDGREEGLDRSLDYARQETSMKVQRMPGYGRLPWLLSRWVKLRQLDHHPKAVFMVLCESF
ncbi:hypothetical protein L1049_009250 [Liquidambar formosana]|uniref:Thioredoxin domain-containing protein n=1 Tax=Liquidambar formosana TaxID=63359 RepID=A0AAP0SBX9_LIQFO